MSRIIRGLAWLALLLFLAFGASRWVRSSQAPIREHLIQAQTQLSAGDPEGMASAAKAKAAWQRVRPWLAIFTSHSTLAELDIAFASLEFLSPEEAAVCCAQLLSMVDALEDDQTFSLQSFL